MTWNYRIVQYANSGCFGLHEVYYDKDGNETSMARSPASFVGETPEDVRGALMMAKADASRRPVFIEPEEWVEFVCKACKRVVPKEDLSE